MKKAMKADMSEKAFEDLIVSHLCDVNGFRLGENGAYRRKYALVPEWVEEFLRGTQAKEVEAAQIFADEVSREKFFSRLSGEIGKVGITTVLNKGFLHNGQRFCLYYPVATEGSTAAEALYKKNIFGVIRQVHFSEVRVNDSIDVVIFLNGLAFLTMELKNHYTHQTYENAIRQYKVDRKPESGTILRKKQCAVHFAVDDEEVWMCTELRGEESRFMPFNRGVDGGAGNPGEEGNIKTYYLWEEILTKGSLSNIIENFAKVVKAGERGERHTEEKVIWPRYHQLEAVMALEAATREGPIGQRFLIQHSAGSGKSNTITWLAYRLLALRKFSSILVVTDRVNLDGQIRDNLLAFQTRSDLVGWAAHGGSLRSDDEKTLKTMLENGKPIIVTTVHKFSVIMDQIEKGLAGKNFAILIDEAHSSQAGEMAGNMAGVVGGVYAKEEDGEEVSFEDRVLSLVAERKMAKNANYYAFTATPKNKTLEMFGTRDGVDAEGKAVFRPFHVYTMRQAIEEGFILDVIAHYTPYKSFYEIVKRVADDPEFDKKKALAKLRAYVEGQPEAIEAKAKIIVEHFCTKVRGKIGGKARAMVVTSSIERAIRFYEEITKELKERKRRNPSEPGYKAIVAFTNKEIDGKMITPEKYNKFRTEWIEKRIVEEPYRILVVADMFQTGYDEPLLHTMYVDKVLTDVKAVQTLSRLNRACKGKEDTFVLDFVNDPEDIRAAFQRYYETIFLAGESDINKLNDLIQVIEAKRFYEEANRDEVMKLLLSDAPNDEVRKEVASILDGIVARFEAELTEEEKIAAKSAMKNFCRIYPFFAAITELTSTLWEKYFGFYSLLVTKLPKLKFEDWTKGLLKTVAFDKFSIQAFEEKRLELKKGVAVVDPGPGPGPEPPPPPDPELEHLSKIVKEFNKRFGAESMKKLTEIVGRLDGYPEYVTAVKDKDEQMMWTLGNKFIEAAMLDEDENLSVVQEYYNDKAMQKFIHDVILSMSKYKILRGEMPKAGEDGKPTTAPRSVV